MSNKVMKYCLTLELPFIGNDLFLDFLIPYSTTVKNTSMNLTADFKFVGITQI